MDKNKDIFGTAIKAFYEENDKTDIIVHSPDFDDDIIPIKYLFRSYSEMPKIEQIALEFCNGKILDVGCGAGSHSIQLQKNGSLEIHAIDISKGAIRIAKKRGVKNAQCIDFFKIENEKFDTILMLMNGSGIIGKLENLGTFFEHAKYLLTENGKVIIDSSDLTYLFDKEITEPEKYYGELEFRISYKNMNSDKFDWLYINPSLLKEYAENYNFECKIIYEGDHFEYLAILKPL